MAVGNGSIFLRNISRPKDWGTLCFLPGALEKGPLTRIYLGNCTRKSRVTAGRIVINAKDDKWRDKLPPFANGSPGLDCPVPLNQQPVNEYQTLSNSALFSWANEDIWKYGLRLAGIGTFFSAFIGWPVTRLSVDPEHELLKCGIGALSAGLFVVILATLRMYLGWAYVGNRLFSATVEYEETGWYDGEVWVKPPEVLARDRLLGSYSVKPVLNRVKITLVVLAILLFTCIVLFISLKSPPMKSSFTGEVNESSGQRAYNDASPRLFEPEAFNYEGKESQLADYCR